MAERLLLVGMMGAGKSTVARMAADRLGWDCADTDEEVARAAGMSVPELFAVRGEKFFRVEESRALRAVLARADPLVVSVGGGAVLDAANRALLRGTATVVWLRAALDTLAVRVGDGSGRPLLAGGNGDPHAALRRIDAERRALYLEVSAAAVDVDDIEPAAVTDRLLAVAGLSAPGAQVRS